MASDRKYASDLNHSALDPYGSGFLRKQALELIEFSQGAVSTSGGFGYLDSSGKVDATLPRQTYVQCRMIQVLGLGHLFDLTKSQDLVEHGVAVLLDSFHDKEHGGFFNAIDPQGMPASSEKLAYDHVFVLLAACTAKVIGVARADELLTTIDEVLDKYFWDEEFQMLRNSWNNDFTQLSEYRGINANMHAVESYAAAFDVTGNAKYLERAYEICNRAINVFARENDWFLPEHFDSQWKVEKDFNIDSPADPFCPFGVTIGHLLEWSRLILHLKMQLKNSHHDISWIDEAAENLYRVAKSLGWAPDGGEGFVYTIDWFGKPVVRARMHWVIAEAVMTAFVLWKETGNKEYLEDYKSWWAYIDANVLDKVHGSWFHELDSNQQVVAGTWAGKPDTYHAFNACILTLYPLSTSFIQTAKEYRER